jgi:hypothetical protein
MRFSFRLKQVVLGTHLYTRKRGGGVGVGKGERGGGGDMCRGQGDAFVNMQFFFFLIYLLPEYTYAYP